MFFAALLLLCEPYRSVRHHGKLTYLRLMCPSHAKAAAVIGEQIMNNLLLSARSAFWHVVIAVCLQEVCGKKVKRTQNRREVFGIFS